MRRNRLHYFIGADANALAENNSWRYAMVVEPDQTKLAALDNPQWPLRNHRLQVAPSIDGLNHSPLSVMLTMALEETIISHRGPSEGAGKGLVALNEASRHIATGTICEAQRSVLADMAARLRFNKMVVRNFLQTCGRGCRILEPTPLEHPPPIIVVGSGPSLAKNVGVLKDIQHRALIFAADSVVDYLLEQGIKPDIAGSLDPQPLVALKLKADFYDFPLIYTPGGVPEVVKRFRTPMLYVPRNPVCVDIAKLLKTPCTSTMRIANVTALLVDVALRLGASPLILVGCDHAVSPEASHVSGAHFQSRNKVNLDRDYPLDTPGWGGGTVRTSAVYLEAIRALECEFQKFHRNFCKPGCARDIYNCTEGGAAIQGAEQATLDGFVFDDERPGLWSIGGGSMRVESQARELPPIANHRFLDRHVLLPVEIERKARLEFNHVGVSGDLGLMEEGVRQTIGPTPVEEHWTRVFMDATAQRQELLKGEG